MPDHKMTIEEAFAELKRLYPNSKIDVGTRIQTDGGRWNSVYVGDYFAVGEDFETTISKIVIQVPGPKQIAAGKRAVAAALLAEADALEGKATP